MERRIHTLRVYSKSGYEEYKGHAELIIEKDIDQINSQHWFFPWQRYFYKQEHHIYKLVIEGASSIQGLISFEYEEGFVLVHVLESAPYNRNKNGLSIAPPLLAFASMKSLEYGNDGVICIISKFNRSLIEYYEKLGATYLGNSRLAFFELEALCLRRLYLN